MTLNEITTKLSKAEAEYLNKKNGEAAREALNEVFAACFSQPDANESSAELLERAYRLLRKIENSSPVSEDFGYRYDIGFVLEGLVFCAEVLSRPKDGDFRFGNVAGCAFVCVEMKSLCRLILNLLANAAKYTDGGDVAVKLNGTDSFAVISVSESGSFDAAVFQNALCGDGSLGFVNRALKRFGGSVVMTEGGARVSLSVRIPLCKKELPAILPFPVEDLLYDRLSPVYIAFCAH